MIVQKRGSKSFLSAYCKGTHTIFLNCELEATIDGGNNNFLQHGIKILVTSFLKTFPTPSSDMENKKQKLTFHPLT